MRHPTVDVVIPVHGGWQHTERCLRSLQRQTIAHRTIVVDNASPDDTLSRLQAGFPAVETVAMGRNAGFAQAVNAGIAAGAGELVVALNNDVVCTDDFLERLAEPFEDERIGSAAPLLLRPGGERVDAFGICVDATLACFVRLQGGRPEDGDPGRLPPLLGPHGAAAAYRRTALEQIGGFDERIFFYGEDLDLALRLRAAGWPCVAVPTARATHEGGATAGKRSRWQREQGGFGRGYVLSRYGVLRGRRAARALLTEAIVVLGDAVISRDWAALAGRIRGWRSGRDLPRRRIAEAVSGDAIGFAASLRLRAVDYGLLARARTPTMVPRIGRDGGQGVDRPEASCRLCGGATTSGFTAHDRNRRVSAEPFRYVRCAECGTLSLADVPADLGRFYPSGYHDLPQSPAEALARDPNAAHRIELVRRLVPTGRLVEVGPSIGAFLLRARDAGYDASGIELDGDCCRFIEQVLKIPVRNTADPAAALDGPYDAIVLWHAIEHLPDPAGFLAAAAGALAPGGTIVLAAPNPDSLQARVLGARWAHVDAPRHLALMPIEALERTVQQHGLETVLATTDDDDARVSNAFGWRVSLAPLASRSRLAVAGHAAGKLLSVALAPIERRGRRGSTYTLGLRRPHASDGPMAAAGSRVAAAG